MTNLTAIDLTTLTITEYVALLNEGASCFKLVDDLDHWAGYGITTATELAEYLDACVERELEKAAYYGDDEEEFYEEWDAQRGAEALPEYHAPKLGDLWPSA